MPVTDDLELLTRYSDVSTDWSKFGPCLGCPFRDCLFYRPLA
jgi:hypothetical protein